MSTSTFQFQSTSTFQFPSASTIQFQSIINTNGHATSSTLNKDKPFNTQVEELLQQLPPASEAQYRFGTGKNGKAPRPPNNYVLFRTNLCPLIREGKYKEGSANTYGGLVSAVWGRVDKGAWSTAAAGFAEEHARLFPEYKYEPAASGTRKRQGKKGKAPESSASPEERWDEGRSSDAGRVSTSSGRKARQNSAMPYPPQQITIPPSALIERSTPPPPPMIASPPATLDLAPPTLEAASPSRTVIGELPQRHVAPSDWMMWYLPPPPSTYDPLALPGNHDPTGLDWAV